MEEFLQDDLPRSAPCRGCGEMHDLLSPCPTAVCSRCGKRVVLEHGFLRSHREPESSAICPASGNFAGR